MLVNQILGSFGRQLRLVEISALISIHAGDAECRAGSLGSPSSKVQDRRSLVFVALMFARLDVVSNVLCRYS